jgi:hypothetical protein
MLKNKKILIIADRIHAQPRMTSLSDEFIELGNEVILYSYSSKNIAEHTLSHVSKNSFKTKIKLLFKKNKLITDIIGVIKYVIFFPDKYFFKWFVSKRNEIDTLVNTFEPDVIISSSSPVTAHIIAWRISKKFQIKWCADFRDMWALNHNHQGRFIGKYLDQVVEKYIIKSARWVVTTTPSWAKTLSIFYNREVYSITNGFCEKKYNLLPKEKTNKHLIRYTGNITENLQRLTFLNFLEALSKMRKENILFEIYGPTYSWLKEEINLRNLGQMVKLVGPISNKDIPKTQIGASLNIIFGCSYNGFSGGYYLKMFEYLGAKKPILLVSDQRYKEASAVLLKEFNYTYEASSIDEIVNSIRKALNNPMVAGAESHIDKYKFTNIAKQYLNIINE